MCDVVKHIKRSRKACSERGEWGGGIVLLHTLRAGKLRAEMWQKDEMLKFVFSYQVFFSRRAPQQMLRTHRSLEAYYATL